MTENKETMAKNIKKQLKQNEVTATDVCKALDIKQNTFSDWVNAKTYPRIDQIQKLADYFNIPKFMLVENEETISKMAEEKILQAYKQGAMTKEFIDLFLNATSDGQSAAVLVLKSQQRKP